MSDITLKEFEIIINNESDVEEIMKRLGDFEARIEMEEAKIKKAQEQIKKAKEMKASVEEALLDYYKDELSMDEDFEFKCEYGEFKARKQTKWSYTDEKAILKYLEENNPNLIRIKKEIDKNNFKKKYEVVDGMLYDSAKDVYIDGVVVDNIVNHSLKINKVGLVNV